MSRANIAVQRALLGIAVKELSEADKLVYDQCVATMRGIMDAGLPGKLAWGVVALELQASMEAELPGGQK